jgi:hypothetical protein
MPQWGSIPGNDWQIITEMSMIFISRIRTCADYNSNLKRYESLALFGIVRMLRFNLLVT